MWNSRDHEALSKRGERRLIEAGRRVLLSGAFPNPERAGCPPSHMLKAIAFRRMSLTEAARYIDHIGSCSPCFIEYAEFQKEAQRRKAFELVLASAALLLLVVFGGGIWRLHRLHRFAGNIATNMPYQKVTLDLRNRLILRGGQAPSANSGPIQLARGRLDLTLLLPTESPPGMCEVGVSTQLERPLLSAMGVAANEHRIPVLKVKLDLSKLSPGTYLLEIGPVGGERREYPLLVK